jgi:hypothetical protein
MPLPANLTDIVRLEVQRALEKVNTTLPGRVLRYDAARQVVDVEIQIKRPVIAQDDEVEWDTLPTLLDVPVQIPHGGGFFVALPLQAGDPVIVHATAASMNQWLHSGAKGSEGPETRLHGLGSVFATPGCLPAPEALADPSGAELRIGKDGSDLQIRIDGAAISLGAGASDYAALSSKVNAALAAIKTHTHLYVPGPGPGTAPTPPSSDLSSMDTNTAASLVKIK